jgi:tetratricopeptide (TPR) repeat protein
VLTKSNKESVEIDADVLKQQSKFFDMVGRAYQHFNEGKYDKAEILFKKIVKIKPEHHGYLLALADILDILDKKDESIDYYSQIVTILGKDTPKYIVGRLLKNYRQLIKMAIDNEHAEQAITLYRVMLGKYPEHVSRLDALRFAKLIGKNATIHDKTLIQFEYKKKLSPKKYFKNMDDIPIKIVETIETRHKPWHSRFLPDGYIFTSAKYSRPSRIIIMRDGKITWEQNVEYLPRGIMLMKETIVLLPNFFSAESVLSTYDYHGRIIAKEFLGSDAFYALSNLLGTHYLLRTYKYENNTCCYSIVSQRGDFVWRSKKSKGVSRAIIISLDSDRWLVADGPRCFVIDINGRLHFEYSVPAEEKVIEESLISETTSIGNHFQVLGIEPTQDKVAIKKAYRAKALQWHPDINPDPRSQEMMKEINRVYFELIESPISLNRNRMDIDFTYSYTIVVRDYFFSGVADPKGKECWLTSSSGKLYSFKDNKLCYLKSLKDRTNIVGLFKHDNSLLLEQDTNLHIYRNDRLKLVHWNADWGHNFYKVLNDPINHYMILIDGSKSLYFIDDDGKCGKLEFDSYVEDMDYDYQKKVIVVAADKLYFFKLNRNEQPHAGSRGKSRIFCEKTGVVSSANNH